MGTFYTSSDWENYEITIHALKSTSRLVGFASLSEKARVLEEYADKNELEKIHKEHRTFMVYYRSCIEKLRALLSKSKESEKNKDSESKKLITKEETIEKLSKALQFAKDFDIDGLDSIVQELNSIELPSDFTEVFEKSRTLVDKLKYKELIALLSENLK